MSPLTVIRKWLARRFRKKPLGERGEDVAAKFLKRHGYRILARGADSGLGELDIVAVDGRTIVFVEVKTRSSDDAGTPAEAIDDHKQQRMTRGALAYLKSQRLLNYAARFDVVAITWPPNAPRPTSIEHLCNVFDAVGRGQFFN